MKDGEPEDEHTETAAALAFFNRGRRLVTDLLQENERLRSAVRRLERDQPLRGGGAEHGQQEADRKGEAPES